MTFGMGRRGSEKQFSRLFRQICAPEPVQLRLSRLRPPVKFGSDARAV